MIWPTVNVVFTNMTWRMSSPALSRKSVFTPHMIEVASV